MSIEIKKVKLIKKGEKIEIGYSEKRGDLTASLDKLCNYPPHKDLTAAIEALKPHFSILAGYQKEMFLNDLFDGFSSEPLKQELDKVFITGYSIGGKDDEPGLTITGMRENAYKKMVIINTPFMKLDTDPDNYAHIDDLNRIIKNIAAEALECLNGKQGNPTQGEFNFEGSPQPGEDATDAEFEEVKPGDTVTRMQIAPPENNPLDSNDSEEIASSLNVISMTKSDNNFTFPDDLDNIKPEESGETNVIDNHKGKPKGKPASKKKKVAQTAEAPSGEVEVPEMR